jgi:DNA polymerase III subunit beta
MKMKFIVNKDEFIHNLNTADSIINVKSPLAMLLNVYIEALDDGTIIMLSYNGENGVKVESTGVVEDPGKITILSKKLLESVRKMPGDRVVIRSKEDSSHEIIIHPENMENPIFNINGISGDAYPIFNEFNWQSYIKIAQETFKEQINATEFSVSTDTSKPAFTGSYIEEALEGYLSFVASDGKRLAVITREYEEKKGTVELGVIIPERIFKTIQSILNTGDVLFSIQNNQAFFKIGNVYMFSNLVDGKFPNYKDVIPADRINIARLDSTSFLQAIDTVSVMSDPDSGKTKIEMEAGKMTIQTSHPIYGIAKQEIPIDYEGSPLAVTFNYKAVTDYLKVVHGKRIEFVVNSQSSPMLMKTEKDDNYIYIAMPLKLYE